MKLDASSITIITRFWR